MDSRDYSQIFADLKNYFESVPRGQRMVFTKKLENILKELICRNVHDEITAECACPRCTGTEYVRYGFTSVGRQRFKCRTCSMIYSEGSCRNLLSNSKLSAETWLEYCGCFVNQYSLRKCARICGVSLYTSFFMRRRILEIMFDCLPPFRAEAGMGMQLDEIYFRESFKGSNLFGRIPRRSRRRGHGEGSGLNKGLKCVITGINDAGDIFFDIAGNGKPSCARMHSVLENRICSGTLVITDREQSYVSVLKGLGVAGHSRFDDRDHGHLSRIDSYHSRIRHFLYRFRGVSTRWLRQYLGWEKLTESFDQMLSDQFVMKKILDGHYSMTRSRMYPNHTKISA